MILRPKTGARLWHDPDTNRVSELRAAPEPAAEVVKPRRRPDPEGRPIKGDLFG